eukprot:Rmarinus@m.20358
MDVAKKPQAGNDLPERKTVKLSDAELEFRPLTRLVVSKIATMIYERYADAFDTLWVGQRDAITDVIERAYTHDMEMYGTCYVGFVKNEPVCVAQLKYPGATWQFMKQSPFGLLWGKTGLWNAVRWVLAAEMFDHHCDPNVCFIQHIHVAHGAPEDTEKELLRYIEERALGRLCYMVDLHVDAAGDSGAVSRYEGHGFEVTGREDDGMVGSWLLGDRQVHVLRKTLPKPEKLLEPMPGASE